MLYTFCGTPSYMAPETAVNGDEKNAYGPPVGKVYFDTPQYCGVKLVATLLTVIRSL
jgi:hypothetical protein